jgi:hypothetical protein
MRKSIAVLGCCLILVAGIHAQEVPGASAPDNSNHKWPELRGPMSHDPNFKRTSTLSFYKRKSEWRKIIDSTWGQGLPLAQKLYIFDYYSGYIRTHNPTFTYTRLNWDSVSTYWRAKISDSTSRGIFSAILSGLARQLHDLHAQAWDSTMTATPLNPGTPILVDFPYDGCDWSGAVSHFGAGLTALPDSSLLVYMVVPNHPLGLEPGDIVLGYEGVPWRNLVHELIAAELPTVQTNACSPSASAYYLLYCAGMNWHLFDTMDVVKYKTGDTIHLATEKLGSLPPVGGLVNGAQLPVPGVLMPALAVGADGFPTSDAVSYGVVEGTNVGYIYIYHQANSNVGNLFNAAVSALSNTHGLIIDMRFALGGWVGLNAGIARLTSYAGPTLQSFARSSGTDLWTIVPKPTDDFSIPQDDLAYEHPVAVLLGPTCMSYGDITSHQLTYLDNVRFFGKPPNAAYDGWWWGAAYVSGFSLTCPDNVVVDVHSPDTQLWGKEFPIDEHVWLTRDGVAKGEDDVVKRAIEWTTTLTYAHDVAMDHYYARPGADSVTVTAVLTNPLHHSAILSATVTDDAGSVRDSVLLCNDGLHGDAGAGDSVWGARIVVPPDEGVFTVAVRTDDQAAGTYRRLPQAAAFATAGPLVLQNVTYVDYRDAGQCSVRPSVKNMGSTAPFVGGTISLTCADTGVYDVVPAMRTFSTIAAGAAGQADNIFCINYDPDKVNGSFTLHFTIGLQGHVCWDTTYRLTVTGVAAGKPLPIAFALEQNYPNPFNPSTIIKYALPHRSHVTLTVYTTLGQQVATLVNGEVEVGYHEVEFNTTRLASGVYFYRLQAGEFVQAKKLVILK